MHDNWYHRLITRNGLYNSNDNDISAQYYLGQNAVMYNSPFGALMLLKQWLSTIAVVRYNKPTKTALSNSMVDYIHALVILKLNNSAS